MFRVLRDLNMGDGSLTKGQDTRGHKTYMSFEERWEQDRGSDAEIFWTIHHKDKTHYFELDKASAIKIVEQLQAIVKESHDFVRSSKKVHIIVGTDVVMSRIAEVGEHITFTVK